jgi:ectoine hydroxylase-related dioxygenase (phytanoyl-CoA dioxygenase family)
MAATAADYGMDDALRECGVTETTLTAAEKDSLDRLGYLVLPDVMDRAWLARLRAAFEAALAQGKRHGQHLHLPWQEPAFDGVYTHPKILAAANHVLRRPFQTGGVVGRDPAPGHGQQALHADWPVAAPGSFVFFTTLWLLDDFTSTNGATRVVAGSHHMPRALPKSMSQPDSRHPQEKLIVASAGSVLLFNGHLLHSGTRNQGGRRRVLQCAFSARDLNPMGDVVPDLPPRLSAAARYLLGERPSTDDTGVRR